MKTILALILLSGCAAASADSMEEEELLPVEGLQMDLTNTCYDAILQGWGPNYAPLDLDSTVAAYTAWNGGYNRAHCTGLATDFVQCTSNSGVHAQSFYTAGQPTKQGAFSPSNSSRVLNLTSSDWDDYIYKNGWFQPSGEPGVRYGNSSVHLKVYSALQNTWKLTVCIAKCTAPAPAC